MSHFLENPTASAASGQEYLSQIISLSDKMINVGEELRMKAEIRTCQKQR
jgi:hypothetical protein